MGDEFTVEPYIYTGSGDYDTTASLAALVDRIDRLKNEARDKKKKSPRPKGYNVRVDLVPDEGYIASWGVGFMSNPAAPSMATALRILANQIEAAGLHGSGEERIADLTTNAHTVCKYCYAPIIFAHLPHPSTKFLAFDCAPADAETVKGVRVATFSKTTDAKGRPVIAWTWRAEGPVWIPHPEVCGDKSEPPENELLLQRWEPRHQVHLKLRQRTIARLQNIITEVNEGALDAN